MCQPWSPVSATIRIDGKQFAPDRLFVDDIVKQTRTFIKKQEIFFNLYLLTFKQFSSCLHFQQHSK